MNTPYPIYIGNDILPQIAKDIAVWKYSQIIVLADENTYRDCYPLLCSYLPQHQIIPIFAGEEHKTLSTCEKIWALLTSLHVDRKALIINLGGGVVGDLGGFVAGIYKRGIDFVQIPTTLLAMCDASVGGKVGIDFLSAKNQLGLFSMPKAVYICPKFLKTLSQREWLSGFAEIVKHHLIADAKAWKVLQNTDLQAINTERLIHHSIKIKANIVAKDFDEQHIRKALNFGHTIGHAIESYFLGFDGEKILHGEAVAIGIICESHISFQKGLISAIELSEISTYIRSYFRLPDVPFFAYSHIFELMKQDKKNHNQLILCVLLKGIGQVLIGQAISFDNFVESLNYYQKNEK